MLSTVLHFASELTLRVTCFWPAVLRLLPIPWVDFICICILPPVQLRWLHRLRFPANEAVARRH